MSMTRRPLRRLLWAVNHKALIPAELPILHGLGFKIFVPKVFPLSGFRSGGTTWDYDDELEISKPALKLLNSHPFYTRSWSPTMRTIIAEHFDVAVVNFSIFTAPLREAVKHFPGPVIARAFGIVGNMSYADIIRTHDDAGLLTKIQALGDRFIFAQGYDNLAKQEPPALRDRAQTIVLPLPSEIFAHTETWTGKSDALIFLCPSIQAYGYPRDMYEAFLRDFGDLPYRIFGQQLEPIANPNVLPYLSDDELITLFIKAPVFVYPYLEERQVHYSPIEAMVIGTPVLYRRGSLLDSLAENQAHPGACSTPEEMRKKAQRLLKGDRAFAEEIRAGQPKIVSKFRVETARQQWSKALGVEV